MDREINITSNGGRVAVEQGDSRPASRARRTASGGIRSPEAAYRTLMDCAADILAGSIDPPEANAVKGVIVGAVVVAKHADLMADMERRCELEQQPEDAARLEEIAMLEARLDELRGARPLPKKG